ncbi:MAG: bifunctional demethylmenaquinone methyltransferase/2-methoxy-6-polyprenyl-1,4-benzoquinol methylase UbiE [Acidobacteria bacterium]|nr:bifunctional demethylmenaquinone methyltransferase/2-methoxy-6-polyprenyl-1,4-benzoquinol methylase UbiE [Acidobacteriota bacterium]
MFDGVAPRYDLLNHLLSMNIDRYWRWRTVRALSPALGRLGGRVVDLCCGSGDLTIALQRAAQGKAVAGSDFSHAMLREAARKIGGRGLKSPVFEADATNLPLADGSSALLTCAFGFRNLANYRKGLAEMLRVLEPGGTAAILEFSTPPNTWFRRVYEFYSMRVLPRIGAAMSPAPEAYRYLPESVRKFPSADELAAEMRRSGFREVRFTRMTFGIVALHIGVK